MKTVLITGADRGVGYCLAERFLEDGWRVMAGQFMPDWSWLDDLSKKYPERLKLIPLDVGNDESVRNAAGLCDAIDLLISCAGIAGGDGLTDMSRVISVNTLGAVRVVEAFLPKMRDGLKRLAFVSSEAGSISVAHRDGGFSYTTSKTMLNMTVRCMFHELRPQGFTFRLYHPGWVRSYMRGFKNTDGNFEPEESAEAAFRQFTEDRNWEDALVMTDISGHMWPC